MHVQDAARACSAHRGVPVMIIRRRRPLAATACLLVCALVALHGVVRFRSGVVGRSLLCRPQHVGDVDMCDGDAHCGSRLIRSIGRALVGGRRRLTLRHTGSVASAPVCCWRRQAIDDHRDGLWQVLCLLVESGVRYLSPHTTVVPSSSAVMLWGGK